MSTHINRHKSVSPAHQPPADPARILLVGGGEDLRLRVHEALGDEDCEITVTGCPESVLKQVRETPWNVVLFDLTSSSSGGSSLVNLVLKSDPVGSVVVITQGSLGPEARQSKRPFYYHLNHPVSDEALSYTLFSAIERSRLLVENASLRSKVLFDDLTSAYNRRYLRRYLEEELERSRRYNHPFSLLFTDLDNLKAINDQSGHLYGSQILRQVAKFFLSELRKSDKVFRFGGDEFVLVLPETDRKHAVLVAERLAEALPQLELGTEEKKIGGVTSSFGSATYPDDGQTGEELLETADKRMYEAKRAGKRHRPSST